MISLSLSSWSPSERSRMGWLAFGGKILFVAMMFTGLLTIVLKGHKGSAFTIWNFTKTATTSEVDKDKVTPTYEADPASECSEVPQPKSDTKGSLITEGNFLLPSPPPPSCSCWNSSDDQCCSRTVFSTHRMGYVLTRNLFTMEHNGVQFRDMLYWYASSVRWDYFAAENRWTQRHALVTRDLVSAIVSGYLYHKTGHECWRNEWGEMINQTRHAYGWMHWFDWEKSLASPNDVPWKDRVVPSQPVQGRDLCEYLAGTSEEEGMGVFADIAIGRWYKKIYEFALAVKERQGLENAFYFTSDNRTGTAPPPRILLVCFEDLADPSSQVSTYHDMMNWFFPAGYDGQSDPTPANSSYTGGHATSSDANLRNRLAEILQRVDEQVFDNWIARANEVLGCGMK